MLKINLTVCSHVVLQLNNIRKHRDGIWGTVESQHGIKGTDSGLPEIESWLSYFLLFLSVFQFLPTAWLG